MGAENFTSKWCCSPVPTSFSRVVSIFQFAFPFWVLIYSHGSQICQLVLPLIFTGSMTNGVFDQNHVQLPVRCWSVVRLPRHCHSRSNLCHNTWRQVEWDPPWYTGSHLTTWVPIDVTHGTLNIVGSTSLFILGYVPNRKIWYSCYMENHRSIAWIISSPMVPIRSQQIASDFIHFTCGLRYVGINMHIASPCENRRLNIQPHCHFSRFDAHNCNLFL